MVKRKSNEIGTNTGTACDNFTPEPVAEVQVESDQNQKEEPNQTIDSSENVMIPMVPRDQFCQPISEMMSGEASPEKDQANSASLGGEHNVSSLRASRTKSVLVTPTCSDKPQKFHTIMA